MHRQCCLTVQHPEGLQQGTGAWKVISTVHMMQLADSFCLPDGPLGGPGFVKYKCEYWLPGCGASEVVNATSAASVQLCMLQALSTGALTSPVDADVSKAVKSVRSNVFLLNCVCVCSILGSLTHGHRPCMTSACLVTHLGDLIFSRLQQAAHLNNGVGRHLPLTGLTSVLQKHCWS